MKKFKLIKWLVKLEDLRTLERLSEVRKESIKNTFESSLKPMSSQELIDRALISNKDIEQGAVYEIENILKSK